VPDRPPTVLSVAGLVHVGVARETNEDCFQVSEMGGPLRRGPDDVVERLVSVGGFALGVYDGAGGFAGGDRASTIAARVVADTLSASLAGARPEPRPPAPGELATGLVRAVTAAGEAILDASRVNPGLRGIGSTATVAAVAGGEIVVAQVGDSRAYVLRQRALVQVTRDDTLLEEALRSGSLKPEDAADFPHRKVLLQALGVGVAPKVGVTHVPARRGDVILLCTDGIHGMIHHVVMRATLLRHRDPGVAARVLLDEALHAGGRDNIALVVARLDGDGLPLPASGDFLDDRGFHPP
jgi:protein phosphatase